MLGAYVSRAQEYAKKCSFPDQDQAKVSTTWPRPLSLRVSRRLLGADSRSAITSHTLAMAAISCLVFELTKFCKLSSMSMT